MTFLTKRMNRTIRLFCYLYKSENKMMQILPVPAANGRFGASGAVARPKVCANLEVYHPSERQWKPRLRQAAGTLSASGGDSVADSAAGQRNMIYKTIKKQQGFF